jgi:acetyl-CoA carboxylase alpha subunit
MAGLRGGSRAGLPVIAILDAADDACNLSAEHKGASEITATKNTTITLRALPRLFMNTY